MCRTGKKRYHDQDAARQAIASIVRLHPGRGKLPQRSYQCPFCNGWHLTSQDVQEAKGVKLVFYKRFLKFLER